MNRRKYNISHLHVKETLTLIVRVQLLKQDLLKEIEPYLLIPHVIQCSTPHSFEITDSILFTIYYYSVCACHLHVEVSGQSAGVSSLLLLCRSQDLNSGYQTWQQTLLPAEQFYQSQ